MKMKEISNKTQADLIKILSEKRQLLRKFRFDGSGAKTKNVKEGRVIRKDIARVLTAMNAKTGTVA